MKEMMNGGKVTKAKRSPFKAKRSPFKAKGSPFKVKGSPFKVKGKSPGKSKHPISKRRNGVVPMTLSGKKKWRVKPLLSRRKNGGILEMILPESLNERIDKMLGKINTQFLAIPLLCILSVSLVPLLDNITGGVEPNVSVALLFLLQAMGGYIVMTFVVLPLLRKRDGSDEILGYKIIFGTFLGALAMFALGLYYRNSTFIATVSFPVFAISVICLFGGMGIGMKRSFHSYIIVVMMITMLVADAVMDIPAHSLFYSVLFASSSLLYVEVAGAGERLDRVKNCFFEPTPRPCPKSSPKKEELVCISYMMKKRIMQPTPESDAKTHSDMKIAFLRRSARFGAISVAIFLFILLFPIIFKNGASLFGLGGYALMLSESVEMGTILIYLLPSAIAVMVLLIIRFIRLTDQLVSSDGSEPEYLMLKPPES